MKIKCLKHLRNIFGYTIEICIEIWRVSLNFGRVIMAIENLKRQFILAFKNFNVAFWLYIIASPQKKKCSIWRRP
jgi:hypothetical protein